MSGLEDMINRFNEMNIISRIIVGCCAVWIVLFIISLIGNLVLGIPYDSYTEDTNTKYADFTRLDLNGDGGLSFDEVKSMIILQNTASVKMISMKCLYIVIKTIMGCS